LPAWIAGWRVLTRPPSISGCPVTSLASTTERPASLSSVAVPPDEISSQPNSARPSAKGTSPLLSETLRTALRTSLTCPSPLTHSQNRYHFSKILSCRSSQTSPTVGPELLDKPKCRAASPAASPLPGPRCSTSRSEEHT